MDLFIKDTREEECTCDVLVLPVAEGAPDPYQASAASLSNITRKVLKEFRASRSEVLFMHSPEHIRPGRLLFVGLGKAALLSPETIRQAGGKALTYLRDLGMQKIALSTKVLSSFGQSPVHFVEGGALGLYAFERYRQKRNGKAVKSVTLLSKPSRSLEEDLAWTQTLTSAVHFCRDLINTPANDMTPTNLADAAVSLKRKGLSVRVLERKDAERLGMGAYLSVAKGSAEAPKFVILEYRGERNAPIALIGKAITFDSGGISLKPSEGMEKMKYDMAGGAVVMGVMKAASEAKLPVHLVGIVPATENLPGGSASRPGDVVKSIVGKTVEIISTDAEGRMALADAIGYAKGLNPRAIIDIATLTGACSIALGSEAIAMMGNDEALMGKIRKSGERTYERVWEMPLFDEYKECLKSDIADLKNTGGRSGSLVSSAYFLKEFAGEIPWVHLDIAGTAWADKEKPYIPKGATGVGVRLLLNMLREMR